MGWVFHQVQQMIPYLTYEQPELIKFLKRHLVPVQPKNAPGN